MAQIGTVSLGRVGGIGDCLIASQSMGVCPDGSDYLGTLDSGGAALDFSTVPNYAQEAADAGIGVPPAPTTTFLPLNLPSLFLPKSTTASPVGLQTNIGCPSGYVAIGGVCSPVTVTAPVSTLIPGLPNWALYSGAGLLLLVVMMSAGGRGRR